MEKQFIIHVGFMKTGSTHLQRNFFPFLNSDSLYVMQVNDPIHLVLQHLISTNEFDACSNRLKANLDNFLSGIIQDKILISEETLIGLAYQNYINHHQITRGLLWYFENIKIIMVIRRQDDFLSSLFVQSLHMGNFGSVYRFLNYSKGDFGLFRKSIQDGINVDVKQVNYHKFYQSYVSQIGANNILVLPYELLRMESSSFLNQICDFIGIKRTPAKVTKDANRSYSMLSICLAQILNRLIISERHGIGLIYEKPFHKTLSKIKDKNRFFAILYKISNQLSVRTMLQKRLDRVIYIKPEVIKPEVKSKILDLHRDSNRQLDEQIKINLNTYGYY